MHKTFNIEKENERQKMIYDNNSSTSLAIFNALSALIYLRSTCIIHKKSIIEKVYYIFASTMLHKQCLNKYCVSYPDMQKMSICWSDFIFCFDWSFETISYVLYEDWKLLSCSSRPVKVDWWGTFTVFFTKLIMKIWISFLFKDSNTHSFQAEGFSRNP